ncbi:hypothetical protein RJ640_013498 [Escallonia rubra]|uniref:Uncharacterized protein n=1 Tax=Escallonia rubra TaxID=112253 RepID=A0AA88S086_9ASTE|nr:hypothetical protein RJ640_013498 [Escallonia rubra]
MYSSLLTLLADKVSVNFLHLALLISLPFQGWHVSILATSLILLDAQTQLEHPMNSSCERVWVIKTESRSQKCSLIEEQHQVFNRLVVLVGLGSLPKFLHYAIVWIDFHSLLAGHVGAHRGVPQSLGFHDPLHLGTSSFASQAASSLQQLCEPFGCRNRLAQDEMERIPYALAVGSLMDRSRPPLKIKIKWNKPQGEDNNGNQVAAESGQGVTAAEEIGLENAAREEQYRRT